MVLVCGFAGVAGLAQTGVEVIGSARFTVLTANLVRIEYQPQRQFIDAPSVFAANRATRFMGYHTKRTANSLIIDTGKIRIEYHNDGKPLSADNLKARIFLAKWVPGKANSNNLGGTSRTLDGRSAPFKLDDGVLSTDGWYLQDDSLNHLMINGWVQSRPKSAGSDWYLFGYGKDYKAALRSLTAISGSVPMPRRYALGAWYSRYWPYTSDDYRKIVAEYTAHDFPLDVMVMDMDWHRDGWTGWSWNRKLLPDAEDLLSWFHKQGLAVTLNLHPAEGVQPHEDSYASFMKEMGEDPASGKTLPFDAGNKRYMDALFKTAVEPLEKNGVDFWWLDWQQYKNTLALPDLQNLTWLNHYIYNHTEQNDLRGISFSRWAGWGDQRYPIHFSGDAYTTFQTLAFEVPFTSTAGNMGCFFWSHDIGGHMGGRNEESYARWCQFGALTAALRSHSTRDATLDRLPWSYPKWAEKSMQVSFHLRSQLFPYIYSSVRQSCRQSIPLNRPMYLEYPNDPEAYSNPQQYLYGDNLLAAPIASAGVGTNRVGRQAVWFPKGDWFNLFTGERFDGSQQTIVTADINEFPVYARGGVPIPMQPYRARMSSAPLSTLIVRCYPGQHGKAGQFALYEDDGISQGYRRDESAETILSYRRDGRLATIHISPASGSYNGQLDKRGYVLELPCTMPAIQAKVDGQTVKSVYDPATQTNRITVPARSIRQACTVTVKADTVDFDRLRVQQIIRRAGLDASWKRYSTIEALLQAALRKVTDADKRELLLASAGVGLMVRSDKPYMYPVMDNPYLYVPKQFASSKQVYWSFLDNLDGTGKLLASATKIMQPMQKGPMLTTDVEPSSPSRGFMLEAKFGLFGQTLSLNRPAGSWNLRQSKSNIAVRARVAVSSVQSGTSYTGVIDGVIDGYPASPVNEWASGGEGAGAWVRLDWDSDQKVDRVWLFDRLNAADQVISGELSFSDGSTLAVGALPNAGDGVAIKFPPKTIRWVKFAAKEVSSTNQNVGLAEIAVFRVK